MLTWVQPGNRKNIICNLVYTTVGREGETELLAANGNGPYGLRCLSMFEYTMHVNTLPGTLAQHKLSQEGGEKCNAEEGFWEKDNTCFGNLKQHQEQGSLRTGLLASLLGAIGCYERGSWPYY